MRRAGIAAAHAWCWEHAVGTAHAPGARARLGVVAAKRRVVVRDRGRPREVAKRLASPAAAQSPAGALGRPYLPAAGLRPVRVHWRRRGEVETAAPICILVGGTASMLVGHSSILAVCRRVARAEYVPRRPRHAHARAAFTVGAVAGRAAWWRGRRSAARTAMAAARGPS